MVSAKKAPAAGDDSREAVMRRCEELIPTLIERAEEAERLRKLPESTVNDLHDAGVFRLLQPKRFGGLELDLEAMLDACTILARGCGSTGWVAGNLISHNWMLGMWPEECQQEIWGETPDVGISSSFAFPAGRAVKVDGGYQVSGRWPFSSGVDCSDWVMLGATMEDTGEGKPGHRAMLVPKRDLEVIDNWFVIGLTATGSKDVAAKDLFVPEHRTVSPQELQGDPPGAKVNPGPLYRIPVLATFGFILTGTTLGVTQAALQLYLEATRHRIATYSGANVADYPTVQIKVGEAASLLDISELLLKRDTREIMDIVARGERPDIDTRHKYRRNGTYTVKLCVQAMELIKQATGAKGLFTNNHFQRYYRDLMAASTHINLNWEVMAISYGRVALGLPSDNPLV